MKSWCDDTMLVPKRLTKQKCELDEARGEGQGELKIFHLLYFILFIACCSGCSKQWCQSNTTFSFSKYNKIIDSQASIMNKSYIQTFY